MVLRKKIKKINIMEKNIMNTKKEIRKFIVEHPSELKKYATGCYSCERKIYLTDKDYVGVEIVDNFVKRLIIRLHVDNRQYSIVYAEGLIDDLDIIWRRFRKSFKEYIAEAEEFECSGSKFLARLKELDSLL